MRHFKEKNLKESTLSDLKKAYEVKLKEITRCATFGEEVVVKNFPIKKRGRLALEEVSY